MHSVEWAAGFLEGEGYIGFKYFNNRVYGRKYPRLTLSISQVYREPLDMFQKIFEVGSVLGPYGPYRENKQPYFMFSVSGDDAVKIIEATLPWLFRKGEQALEALEEYRRYNA